MGWHLEGASSTLRRREPACDRVAPGQQRWARGLVGTGSEAILAGFRRHPILITAPVAALALGAGYAAQALLRPGPTAADRQLLDTLIASPQPSLAAR